MGRQLAAEILSGTMGGAPLEVSDNGSPTPERLLEAGVIDAEEYRRRIAANPPAAAAPRKSSLTSARSQGSVAVARPMSQRTSFAELPADASSSEGTPSLVAPPQMREMREMSVAVKGRAMTFNDHEREFGALQQAYAAVTEELEAKEMVMQGVCALMRCSRARRVPKLCGGWVAMMSKHFFVCPRCRRSLTKRCSKLSLRRTRTWAWNTPRLRDRDHPLTTHGTLTIHGMQSFVRPSCVRACCVQS